MSLNLELKERLNWAVVPPDLRDKVNNFLDNVLGDNNDVKAYYVKDEEDRFYDLFSVKTERQYINVSYPVLLNLFGVADNNGSGVDILEKMLGKRLVRVTKTDFMKLMISEVEILKIKNLIYYLEMLKRGTPVFLGKDDTEGIEISLDFSKEKSDFRLIRVQPGNSFKDIVNLDFQTAVKYLTRYVDKVCMEECDFR